MAEVATTRMLIDTVRLHCALKPLESAQRGGHRLRRHQPRHRRRSRRAASLRDLPQESSTDALQPWRSSACRSWNRCRWRQMSACFLSCAPRRKNRLIAKIHDNGLPPVVNNWAVITDVKLTTCRWRDLAKSDECWVARGIGVGFDQPLEMQIKLIGLKRLPDVLRTSSQCGDRIPQARPSTHRNAPHRRVPRALRLDCGL